MNASVALEQFACANQASIETLTALASKALTQAERLTALNLSTARAVLEDSVAATQTVLAVKNAQDLVALQTALVQPILDKSVAYGRSVYEITSEGQQEFAKLFETQVAELNKTFTDALDKATKSAPAGSEPVFAAFKSALAAVSNVFDGVNKATKQATEFAEANIAVATKATVKAATKRPA